MLLLYFWAQPLKHCSCVLPIFLLREDITWTCLCSAWLCRQGNHEELGIESWGGSGFLSGCVGQLSSPTYPDTWELGKLFCSLDQWTLCYSSSSFCQCQCNVSWWLRAKRTSNDPSVLSSEGFWGPPHCSDLRSSVLWPVSLGDGYIVVKSLSHVWLLCGPLDCTSPGSSVHGILQGRILECVAIS